MPELPEVETIRIQLEKFLRGRQVVGIEVKNPKSFQGEETKILDTKILGTRRFGKVIVIDFANSYSALIHLKLTGQLLINAVPGPHTRVVFSLDRGRLIFNDLRKFGWIRIVKSDQILSEKLIGKLGPEPLVGQASSGQAGLTHAKFREILAGSSRPIKLVLMDQEKISGIGNIYANEALWLAKINPRQPARQLDSQATGRLYEAILKVLKLGLKWGGASDQAYLQPSGEEGQYQEHFLVYGQAGEPCDRCHKAKIAKIQLGGRGTYFCPVCQK